MIKVCVMRNRCNPTQGWTSTVVGFSDLAHLVCVGFDIFLLSLFLHFLRLFVLVLFHKLDEGAEAFDQVLPQGLVDVRVGVHRHQPLVKLPPHLALDQDLCRADLFDKVAIQGVFIWG